MSGRNKNTEMALFMKIAFYTLFALMLIIMIAGTIMLPNTVPIRDVDLELSKYLMIPICAALIAAGVGLMALTRASFKAARFLGWFTFLISAAFIVFMDAFVAYWAYSVVSAL